MNISNKNVAEFLKSVILLNDKDLHLINLRSHYLKIIESSKQVACDFLLNSYSFGYISDDDLPVHLKALKEVGVDTKELANQISSISENPYVLPNSIKEESRSVFPESFYGVVKVVYFHQKSLMDIESQLKKDLDEQAPTASMWNCASYQLCNKLLTFNPEWADSNYDQPVFVDHIKHLSADQYVRAELFKIMSKESFDNDLAQWMKESASDEFTHPIHKG